VAARGDQATVLQRPLQSLYPLEIHISSSDNVDEETSSQDHSADKDVSSANDGYTSTELDITLPSTLPDCHSDTVEREPRRESTLKA